MKNILLITDGFPYGDCERGFITTEFYELIKYFHVTILATYRGQTMDSPIPGHIKVMRYTNPDERYKMAYSKFLRSLRAFLELRRPEVREDIGCAPGKIKSVQLVRKICLYSNAASELEKFIESVIREDKIDIVYSYWCIPATIACIRAKRKHKTLKVITRFHGFDLYNEQCPYGYQTLRRYVVKNCEKLVFVCKYGEQYFNTHWGGNDKSTISYLGTRRMPVFGISGGSELKLISLSNLCLRKRVHLIIEGLAMLSETVKVSWMHIGDGELRPALEEKAHRLLDGKQNIRWNYRGRCRNSQIEIIYEEFRPDVFITTTAHEGGAPVTIQEAFAMGIPAIGTATGGVTDLIYDGVTGILISRNPEPREIADAIRTFYESSLEVKQQMSLQCRELWKKTFDAQNNAGNMIDMIRRL